MKRTIVAITAVGLVLGVGLAALAASPNGRTPPTCMDSLWRTTAQSTSSTQWAPVAGFSDDPVAIYPIAINVSAEVSGSPVDFRIQSTNVGVQTFISKAGATRFVPDGSGPDSFAYQWIEKNQSAATHSIHLELQWKSSDGGTVTLERGDMSVLYTTDACKGA